MTLAARLAYRAKDLLFPPFADKLWKRRVLGEVRCLVYHRVGSIGDHPSIDACGAPVIKPEELARDIRFLQRQGAKFLTFTDLREGKFPADDEFGVVLSFDDGTADVYRLGLPVLESLGVRGVVFQVSSFIDAERLSWEHLLYQLWSQSASRTVLLEALSANPKFEANAYHLSGLRNSLHIDELEVLLRQVLAAVPDFDEPVIVASLYPTSREVRDAADLGHEIGSHGHGHFMRSTLDAKRFEYELKTSKAALEEVVARTVEAYSHPFNSYQSSDRELLQRYYQQAATVDAQPIKRDGDPYALARFNWPGRFPNNLRWRRWLWTGA